MEPVDCIIRCILFFETIPSLMFFNNLVIAKRLAGKHTLSLKLQVMDALS